MARGIQIDFYEFTAFGVIVIPYVTMSALNIIAALITPTYPSMFLVETHDLDKARRRGGEFAGAIAKIDTSKNARPVPTDFINMLLASVACSTMVSQRS